MNYHFENVVPSSEQFRWLGGADRIMCLQRLMDELESELRECPFCGGKAAVRGGFTYASPCVRVQCTSCKCETSLVIEGKELISGKDQSLEECARIAARVWNRRP